MRDFTVPSGRPVAVAISVGQRRVLRTLAAGRGQAPRRPGSFRVDDEGAATLTLPLPADPKAFTYFDLSLEPADGDPGHSGVSVLRGPSAA